MDIVIFNIDPISTIRLQLSTKIPQPTYLNNASEIDSFVSALLNISAKPPKTLHISLYHKGVVWNGFL